ncbi:hypothetical protein [Metabacillus malikii]|uniref:Uncharacterized protein n=1 Tax=Metabacillus malikii TaxID=1504265 RepID=A0ABT9ZB49_9BACI|nr:hypothetical protein [Metabacillus malikii]MDQ0229478.1 hypothetical protein [Metabacillus malikii]
MIKYQKMLLAISFVFLIFNGSSLGFIFYQERLGAIFGIILFYGTSLFAALLASIAYENTSTYYSRFFFLGNLIVLLLPLYYLSVSSFISYTF